MPDNREGERKEKRGEEATTYRSTCHERLAQSPRQGKGRVIKKENCGQIERTCAPISRGKRRC